MPSRPLTRYVRYAEGASISYGIRDRGVVHQLAGDLFEEPRPTGYSVPVHEVQLLVPVDPARVSKVIGVPGNYDGVDEPPRALAHPRWFAKLPTSLNPHEAEVELPPEAQNLNYEGEMVIVIGKHGRHIPIEHAPSHVFGIAVGNDWSENTWFTERNVTGERRDLLEPSKLIAKGMDTWGCIGTDIVVGLDYADYMDLALDIRLNGTLVAHGRTRNMSCTVAEQISYISYFVTLLPGDLIYTGTVRPPSLPGARRQMRDGDVVEVELEKVGLLRNRVVAMDRPIPNITLRPASENTP